MLISTQGLITKSINIGENNKLISILTKDHGLISAFLNNCNKLNSKLLAASNIFSYCNFILFKYKGKFSVNEVHCLKNFKNISSDLQKFSLSCYLLQLFNEIAIEEPQNNGFLRLLLNALFLLDQNKRDILTVKSVTELKLASIAGFMPNLVCCSNCLDTLKPNKYWFLISGELICNHCFNNNKIQSFPVTTGVLFALRFITFSNISHTFSFKINNQDKLILASITQEYLLFKTGLNLDTLKYFHDVTNNLYNINNF